GRLEIEKGHAQHDGTGSGHLAPRNSMGRGGSGKQCEIEQIARNPCPEQTRGTRLSQNADARSELAYSTRQHDGSSSGALAGADGPRHEPGNHQLGEAKPDAEPARADSALLDTALGTAAASLLGTVKVL